MSRKPTLAITLGDPAGIGPEIWGLAQKSGRLPEAEYRIFGEEKKKVQLGRPDLEGARIALQALEQAATAAVKGEVDAVVTCPVSKYWLHQVGFSFPGQTEFFAARAGVTDYAMLLTAPQLTVALVTAHIPLKDVIPSLSVSEIVRVGRLLDQFLVKRLGSESVRRIAVAGVNPHAGENGELGNEELQIIGPAIQELQKWCRAEVSGPYSPDTVFYRAVHGDFDAVLCMYHDQGLIPLKLLGFESGVNVTLGLPFIRTSPDHGTAFDIAGTGKAKPDSLIAAVRLAWELSSGECGKRSAE